LDSLAYPIGDVVVGTIVLFVLARARMGRGTSGTPLPLLGGGLVIVGVRLTQSAPVEPVASVSLERAAPASVEG